jgi:hypothetical protein
MSTRHNPRSRDRHILYQMPGFPCKRSSEIRQSRLNVLSDVMDGVDFADDVDAEKIHPRGYVRSVHKVHSVHYLDEFNWLQLPNLGSMVHRMRPELGRQKS